LFSIGYWARAPELPFIGRLIVFPSGADSGLVFADAWARELVSAGVFLEAGAAYRSPDIKILVGTERWKRMVFESFSRNLSEDIVTAPAEKSGASSRQAVMTSFM
jgi:hypothetical protein